MKITDFDFTDKAIYDEENIKAQYGKSAKEAGATVLNILNKVGVGDYATQVIMKSPYLWVDILKPDGYRKLQDIKQTGNDFTLLRLLDD